MYTPLAAAQSPSRHCNALPNCRHRAARCRTGPAAAHAATQTTSVACADGTAYLASGKPAYRGVRQQYGQGNRPRAQPLDGTAALPNIWQPADRQHAARQRYPPHHHWHDELVVRRLGTRRSPHCGHPEPVCHRQAQRIGPGSLACRHPRKTADLPNNCIDSLSPFTTVCEFYRQLSSVRRWCRWPLTISAICILN